MPRLSPERLRKAGRVAVPRPSRAFWVCQLVGWTLYGGFNLALFAVFVRFSRDAVLISGVIAGTLLLLSHGLRYFIRARGWEQLAPLPLLGRLLGANLGLAVLSQLLIWALIIWVVRPAPTGQPYGWGQFLGYVLNVNFVLWLWCGFYFGWHYLRRFRQAEVDQWKLAAAVREAEMRTLKTQLNPHFLFNGLNNIRALVLENPARARTMMTHLSDLLRYSIQLSSAEQVPLRRELEIVRHYLELESLQLEERLTYSLDVDPAALDVLLPPMTLQLLVENAIKHGLAPRPAGGTIRLAAQLDETGALRVTVRNTGRYHPQPGHDGVGVRNARERLALLYGPAARLDLHNSPTEPDTVEAQLCVPVTPLSL
ncbi:sensor histidine kinase [Hymenobacter weizhouensis]|uniref:sensor histidine kinase n=1 Tax=Hymenobacter sp. YIM 151500-1 TaxID=2987689 RepID=UPI002227D30F|nr:histidine kinase [Hymenobacter sp. YIM 151500-1]UYZ64780.1 histidine kinase [Hymenobacter sp. YIM 151500-1]